MTAAARSPDTGHGVGLTFGALKAVVAPATLLTALLFYFGWLHTKGEAQYFGIDPSVLGFSTQDYLLRSVQPIFWPLGLLLLIGLFAGLVHGVVATIGPSRFRRALKVSSLVLLLLGIGGLTIGLFSAGGHPILKDRRVTLPVILGLGVLFIAYATHVLLRIANGMVRRLADSLPRWLSDVSTVIVSVLVVLAIFWAIGDYALLRGWNKGERTAERRFDVFSNIVVYSSKQLYLEGPGVFETRLSGQRSSYRYRYAGLKLLIHSGEKFILLPAGWSRTVGTLFILPESEGLRFEFSTASPTR